MRPPYLWHPYRSTGGTEPGREPLPIYAAAQAKIDAVLAEVSRPSSGTHWGFSPIDKAGRMRLMLQEILAVELAVNGRTQTSHRCRIEDRVRGWGRRASALGGA